ncbi:MAG: FAD-binding oxidoreductase [Caldilineales bacterium]|nr:FAD-binding oxidoreductase [Caldilineales bacterium]MDW8318909.1 FAD-dependent oxidoreductase [Anaerolineae bacterium]
MSPEPFRSKSYWLEVAGPYTESPPLETSIEVDVAVVGGGYSGLSAAFYLKQAEPGLRVALLEQEVIGYGASGRNAGFAMTLFGLTMETTKLRFGEAAVREAQQYMDRAVEHVGELVRTHGLQCDYERTGLITVAISEAGKRRLMREVELANRLGFSAIRWIEQDAVRSLVNSPTYLGARVEDNCALVNPAKLAWEMKRLCLAAGVEVYERTPVQSVQSGRRVALVTPRGVVNADKAILATNAYSIAFPQVRRKQVAVYTYIVLTEPLSPEQLAPIGWQGRQGIEDGRNLVHYYRLTPDNRLLMGGGDVEFFRGGGLGQDQHAAIRAALEDHVRRTFPSLRDVRFTHHWGGPVSVPFDMAPAVGYADGDHRLIYALGCVGHGVSLALMNGVILRDLALERRSQWTDLFFVNRRTIPWPGEPIFTPLARAIRGGMRWDDRRSEG